MAFAALLITAAAVGDRFGRRRVFAIGLGVFAGLGGVGVRPGAGVLIAARAVQGVGAAMLMPLALALLNAAVPPQRRGWAMGIFGSVTALAVVVGPVLGGAITQGIARQRIFRLNVPIDLITVTLALRRLARVTGPGRTGPARRAAGHRRGARAGVGPCGAPRRPGQPRGRRDARGGRGARRGFTGWERRARAPMRPMRLSAIRGFSAGNAVVFPRMRRSPGRSSSWPSSCRPAWPESARRRAAAAALGAAPLLIAPGAGKLADRIGERTLVVSGLLLLAAGFAWIAVIAAPGWPSRPCWCR